MIFLSFLGLLTRFYKRISSLSKQKPTERARPGDFILLASPSFPQSFAPPGCGRSPYPAPPQGAPSPWPCRGRSSSTTPTVTACRHHLPLFLAKFQTVFLRFLGFNRVRWSRLGFVLLNFCRCGDGVHRGVGGDLPGSAVPRRVPSGDFFSQHETILSCFGKH